MKNQLWTILWSSNQPQRRDKFCHFWLNCEIIWSVTSLCPQKTLHFADLLWNNHVFAWSVTKNHTFRKQCCAWILSITCKDNAYFKNLLRSYAYWISSMSRKNIYQLGVEISMNMLITDEMTLYFGNWCKKCTFLSIFNVTFFSFYYMLHILLRICSIVHVHIHL